MTINMKINLVLIVISYVIPLCVEAQTQNLWVVNTETQKVKLIPKNNYETIFKLRLDKYPKMQEINSHMTNRLKFPPDSGYIGSFLMYESILNDSIILKDELYGSFSNYYHKFEYKIAVNDITEIYLQRTYNKKIENLWVYGGFFGALSLIVSPFFYFNDNKPVGIILFSLGAVSTSSSYIAFKLHIGFEEFKKPKFKFIIE